MLKIHFVLNSFIWNYVKDGVILLAALTAAVIILSAVFTVIELRKNKAVYFSTKPLALGVLDGIRFYMQDIGG